MLQVWVVYSFKLVDYISIVSFAKFIVERTLCEVVDFKLRLWI